MTKQPEALRLADALKAYDICASVEAMPDLDVVAVELRRLHEVNQELMEALKEAYEFANGWIEFTWVTKARAAIAKAGEQP